MTCPIRSVRQVARVLDGEVDCSLRWKYSIATILAILIRLVLVDNAVLRGAITGPHQSALVLRLDFLADELHGVARLVGPDVVLCRWSDSHQLHRISRPEDVEVCLEIEYVVVHAAGKSIVDVVAVVVILGVVGGLNVAGSSHHHLDTAVHVKLVAEHVVIVSDRGDCTHDKIDVLGVRLVAMSLHGVVGVELEETHS